MNQRDAVGHPNGVCGHLCLWGRISVLVASVCEFRPTAPNQPTYNHIPDLPGRGFDAQSVTNGVVVGLDARRRDIGGGGFPQDDKSAWGDAPPSNTYVLVPSP